MIMAGSTYGLTRDSAVEYGPGHASRQVGLKGLPPIMEIPASVVATPSVIVASPDSSTYLTGLLIMGALCWVELASVADGIWCGF